jgi:hypothetical protein
LSGYIIIKAIRENKSFEDKKRKNLGLRNKNGVVRDDNGKK